MTRLFNEDGSIVPSTILDASNNVVVQSKNNQQTVTSTTAIIYQRTKVKVKKSQLCYFIKHNCQPSNVLRTSDLSSVVNGRTTTSRVIRPADFLKVGQKVKVSGKSIGKGFAGVIKRHNFRSGRASHGNSKAHNKPGSVGMTQDPGRVFPGKLMAGHLGNSKVSISGVEIVFLAKDGGFVAVKGPLPGYIGSHLTINF